MIARRCIYGVDLNAITVQLARLSIWIHTFVPGLPLSLLDHNLVHGNALVGVGSMKSARNLMRSGHYLRLTQIIFWAGGGTLKETCTAV